MRKGIACIENHRQFGSAKNKDDCILKFEGFFLSEMVEAKFQKCFCRNELEKSCETL